MEKINLQEILDNYRSICSFKPMPDHFIKLAMKEAIRQALVLAAEKVEINAESEENKFDGGSYWVYNVDKQSILDIINLIE